MTYSFLSTASPPLHGLALVAAAGFAASALLPAGQGLSALCGALGRVPLSELPLALGPGWSAWPMLAEWSLMVAAMMPLLVADPVDNVWRSSIASRRPRALGLFALGYASVWLAAAIMLIPAAVLLLLLAPGSVAFPAALALSLTWSASPFAQKARNLCHRRHRVGAFGPRADRECLVHGLRTGTACFMTCWPWMLVPFTVESGHVAVMAAVTLVLFCERIVPAGAPRWQVPPVFETLRAAIPRQKVLGRP
jgi:predicted metal-binding membrane protein